MSQLILVRHGESEWNAKGLWTGLMDIGLSKRGKEQAKNIADFLKDIHFDFAYTSVLKRAKETFEIIKKNVNLSKINVLEDKSLNERDYGIYTGKNKWEIQKEYGEEKFLDVRRDWNYPIPGGETLRDVYNRVVPYFQTEILPKLKEGKNILVVAHGNSLRALVKYLDGITDEDVKNLEIPFGQVYFYEINPAGNIISKKVVGSKI